MCLYHYPHHLWSIPIWVADLNLGYTLYCRSYAQSTFETVLYAVSPIIAHRSNAAQVMSMSVLLLAMTFGRYKRPILRSLEIAF